MNGSIDLLSKSMDRFLYDKDLRHERVKTREDAFVKIKMHVKKYRNLKWTLSHLLSHYVSVLFAYCNVIPFHNLFDTKIFYCLRRKRILQLCNYPNIKNFLLVLQKWYSPLSLSKSPTSDCFHSPPFQVSSINFIVTAVLNGFQFKISYSE